MLAATLLWALVVLMPSAGRAVEQTPKNGCQSETIPAEPGYLTSPEFITGGDSGNPDRLFFHAWWEIESVDQGADDFGVEISTDGGATWPEELRDPGFVPPPTNPASHITQ